MLPHPDSLSLPLKEGIRDLRCSIRLEARSGTVASRMFGTPRPTRRLARLADGVLSHAERVATLVLPRDAGDLARRMDRLAAALQDQRPRPADLHAGDSKAGDLYALCREILAGTQPSGSLVSELKLAAGPASDAPAPGSDPILAAVARAHRMATGGVLRPCLSRTLVPGANLPGPDDRTDAGDAGDEDLDARLALTCWLAVIVRFQSGQDARRVIESSRLAVEAEGDAWVPLLRDKRLPELAAQWRKTVPYLP